MMRVYSCLNHEDGGDMDDRINSEVERFQAISGNPYFKPGMVWSYRDGVGEL